MSSKNKPSSETIIAHRSLHPKITINVGGEKHEVMWELLEKRTLTRLGKLSRARTHETIMEYVDSYSLENNEIYFDRDPLTFNSILNYYRTNRLHMLEELCILDFTSDLEFWMIKEVSIEVCCIEKFATKKEHCINEMAKALFREEEEEEEDFGTGYFVPYQKGLWDLFEKPQSSQFAKVVSLWSIGLVIISTAGMCINTFPWMQGTDVNGDPIDNHKLALVEAVCISYFSLEFLMRFAGSPHKWEFLKGTMNVVDCLAIAPYYLTLFFVPPPDMGQQENQLAPTMDNMVEEEEDSGFGNAGKVMQVFRIARIMRIFKLARRSVGLQSMAYTVRNSWKDLGLLFSLVLLGMLVFGSLEYFVEYEEEDTGINACLLSCMLSVQLCLCFFAVLPFGPFFLDFGPYLKFLKKLLVRKWSGFTPKSLKMKERTMNIGLFECALNNVWNVL